MSQLEKIKKRLKNLKQYKDLSDDQINALVKEQLEKEEILGSLTFCIDKGEKKFAQELLSKYLEESSIENIADRDTLRQLIDLSVIIERVKVFLNQEYKKANPAIPTHMLEELRKTNEQILTLKEKLGLTSSEKQQDTGLEIWDKLKKKALKYYEEHKGCNIAKCPYCNKFFYLLMRVKDLEPHQASFFRGTILYNEKLYELFHHNRISKEEMASIFGISTFYIDFLYNGIYLQDKKES